MSPYKPQHEIRCAHCKGDGAATDCPDCGRQVCHPCASEAGGCPSRPVERHSFGRFAHVVAVCPNGERALVSLLGRRQPKLVRLAGPAAPADDTPLKVGLLDALRRQITYSFSPDAQPVATDRSGPSYRAAKACACSRHIARVHRNETVSISVRGGPAGEARESLRGRVLEVIGYDCKRRRLAVAIRGALHEFACDGEHRIVRRESSVKLERNETPAAITTRGGVVSLVTRGTSARLTLASRSPDYTTVYRLRVYRSHETGLQAMPTIEWAGGVAPIARTRGPSETSRTYRSSGRHDIAVPPRLAQGSAGEVALALENGRVLSANAETGAIQLIADHAGEIVYIGFARDRLATADSRGQLFVRDKVADGYAELR